MNLILHQFKTDLLHFRLRLAVLWLLFALEPILAGQAAGSQEVGQILQGFLVAGEAAFAGSLIVGLLHADALAGATAGWLTRPVRRSHLFAAKTAFLLLCLLLPRLAVNWLGWSLSGYSTRLCLVAEAQMLLWSGAFMMAVAVLAAFTNGWPRFLAGVGLGAAAFFASALTVEIFTRVKVLPEGHAGRSNSVSFTASATAAALVVFLAGVAAAWVLQVRARRPRAALLCLGLGLLSVPWLCQEWPLNFLSPRRDPAPGLRLVMLETNLPAAMTGQRLWAEFALEGVPAGQMAVVRDVNAAILFAGDQKETSLSRPIDQGFPGLVPPAESEQRDTYYGLIRGFFPSNTLWFQERYYYGGGAFPEIAVRGRFGSHPPGADCMARWNWTWWRCSRWARRRWRPRLSRFYPAGG